MKKMTLPQWIITIICLFLFFGNSLIPPFAGFNSMAVSIICIFVATILMFVFVNNIWPTFLCVLAFYTSGVYTMNGAIQASFGHNVYNFVVLAGALFYCIGESGLLKRLAVFFISRKFVKKNPWFLVIMLYLAFILIGSVMNITASCMLFCAIGAEILGAIGITKGKRFGEIMMLGMLMFGPISGAATPIGHSMALTAIEYVAPELSLLSYSLFGYIMSAIMLVAFIIIAKIFYKMDVSLLKEYDAQAMYAELGPMKKQEKFAAVVFAVCIILWLLPSILSGIAPDLYKFINGLGVIGPMLIACSLLCLIPIEGKPMMDIVRMFKEGVQWPAALQIAAAMILGSAMGLADAGIPAALGSMLEPVLAGMSPIIFVAIVALITNVVTQFASCQLTVTIMASICAALLASGVIQGVNAPALAIVLGWNSSIGYATAPGGTPAAIVAGQGWVRSNIQFSHGMLYGILGWAVSILVYILASAVL